MWIQKNVASSPGWSVWTGVLGAEAGPPGTGIQPGKPPVREQSWELAKESASAC